MHFINIVSSCILGLAAAVLTSKVLATLFMRAAFLHRLSDRGHRRR